MRWEARSSRKLLCLRSHFLAVYKEYGSETISAVPFVYGPPLIFTSSLEVANQVLDGHGPFDKHPDSTAALM